MKYGLSSTQWQAALDELHDILIGLAKQRQTITYGELSTRMTVISPHPAAYVFHALLRAVCDVEASAGRGLICALVVSKATGIPGQGFFKLMISKERDCSNQRQCWQVELERIYKNWDET